MSFRKLAATDPEEIVKQMEAGLQDTFEQDSNEGQIKALDAIDKLSRAATLFDETGHDGVAIFLTNLITKIAQDINDFKACDTKELARESERAVKNLKQHGWVFDLNKNLDDPPEKLAEPKELSEEERILSDVLEDDAEKYQEDDFLKELRELAGEHGLYLDDDNENEEEQDFLDT